MDSPIHEETLVWFREQLNKGRHPAELKEQLFKKIEVGMREIYHAQIAREFTTDWFDRKVIISANDCGLTDFHKDESIGRLRQAWFDAMDAAEAQHR